MDKAILDELLIKHITKSPIKKNFREGNVCVSYDRVSSKDQLIKGNSLIWQLEQIDAYAIKNDLDIKHKYGGTYESAKTDERKELKQMLADVKKDTSIVAILIYSYDRFSRTGANGIFLVENLEKLGVRLIAITQKVEFSTPTGKFHENLYMLLSKFDNDMRKDKSVSGTKSILRRGYWPYGTPLGYTNQNKFGRADLHIYVINNDGILIQKAFNWKAKEGFTNKVIVDKLNRKGLKISLRNLAWIFANTFYCGYVTSALLPGELIKGKHPALIDANTFLQVNSICQQNTRIGVPKKLNVDELPLKVFMRDAETGSPFTGSHNKEKNLFYYKSRIRVQRLAYQQNH